ncbi:ATP-sensitive inward rectifier potassium channel 10-like [Octopus sinensis]|uniref:ATP-sensitive inward rectifier potassium channel 10-like n=1 Tax=Octopus sinensis TaxID=2607531 RepID=A0A6P7SHT6_9MOLL|nr:ATP-sensitive inward rectifier potassium channel 10-like [Octopus sinensis]
MVTQNTDTPTNRNYILSGIWNYFCKYLNCINEKTDEDPGHFLLTKAGNSLIDRKGLERHRFSFIEDYYNTILEMRWHWAILVFLSSHAITFTAFAVIWWLNSYIHGDFNSHNSNSKPCLPDLETFADFFLFSVETQTTIGYGFVYPSTDCVSTIPTLFFQVLIGFILEAISLGFVFAKMVRPKNRSNTVMFSYKACLCYENGHPVLQIQVADLRHTHLINAKVGGMLVAEYVTLEGFVHPLYQVKVDFEINNVGSNVFLMWPVILTHYITDASPFFCLNLDDLLVKKIELIVWINGVIESTGEMCQVKTSYIAEEIVWGYRFAHANQFDQKNGHWNVDFTRFGELVPCPMSVSSNFSDGYLTMTGISSETKEEAEVVQTVADIH